MQALLSVPGKVFGLAVLCGTLFGCSIHKNGENLRFQLPWADQNGVYALHEIQIHTMSDIKGASGAAAVIQVNPALSASGGLMGETPSAQYMTTSNGLVIPEDFLTLQLFTLYAHYEKLMELDQRMQIGQALFHPRRVAVAMNVFQDSDPHKLLFNNALYYAPIDATFFVPYQMSDLPISLNGGLIAHEHFHALFNALVAKDLSPVKAPVSQVFDERDAFSDSPGALEIEQLAEIGSAKKVNVPSERTDKYRDMHNIMVIRALNEGLADFWGWVYTGDDLYIGKSLPDVLASRRLDLKPEALKIQATLAHQGRLLITEDLKQAVAHAYGLAAYFSRTLVYWAKLLQQKEILKIEDLKIDSVIPSVDREAAALELIAALPALSEQIKQGIKNGELLSPNVLVSAFFDAKKQTKMNTLQCDFLKRISLGSPSDLRRIDLSKCGTPAVIALPTPPNESEVSDKTVATEEVFK